MIELIGLPEPGTKSVPIGRLSKRAEWLLGNLPQMLHPDGEERMSVSNITPYTDPALKGKRALLRLAARMAQGGMTRLVPEAKGFVHCFTVVKKIEVDHEGVDV